jgi:hypothetical protein
LDSATLFKNINELIVAVSRLLWPIVTIIVVFLFRSDITALLTRVRKGKLFGQELELDPNVSDFQRTVKEAEQEVPEISSDKEDYDKKTEKLDSDIHEVLKASEINPEIGILRLSTLLEKDIRIIAASLGDIESDRKASAIRQFQVLLNRKRLPRHTSESLKIFWDLRNRIVHGHGKHDKHDILRILDIGLNLLKTIRSIPHETNIVYHPGVILYEDDQCTNMRQDVKGLILETTSSDGSKTFKRIFPTRRDSYYKKGKRVTWEWDLSHVWNKTWYIHPDTNEKTMAWDSAGEFTGRHVDEV